MSECAICDVDLRGRTKNDLGGPVFLRLDPEGEGRMLCFGLVDETGQRIDCWHKAQIRREERFADELAERRAAIAVQDQSDKKAKKKARASQLVLAPREEN